MKTILITGATGKVSAGILEHLVGDKSVKLRALVRDENKAAALQSRGVELAVGDLERPRTLPAAFEGIDTVWLLSPPGPRAPEQQSNGLWAARSAGVKRVVRMSVIKSGHDAPTINARMHGLSDAELMASGLRYTILKPHFFLQNLFGSAATIKQGSLYYPMGSAKLGMIDSRDISDVAARVLVEDRFDGRSLTLTGPESIDFQRVAKSFSNAIGKPVSYVPVPLAAAVDGFKKAGLGEWSVTALEDYMAAYAAGWGDFVTDDVREVLGRAARSIDDFTRDHAAAFKG
jgi:uncharacterized protein YbjT (DUF2867 family)